SRSSATDTRPCSNTVILDSVFSILKTDRLQMRKVYFLFATAASLSSQPSASRSTFEVASVRTVDHPERALAHAGMIVHGLRVDIPAMSFAELIALAYGVRNYQVSGPDWIKSQRYIIQAKLPDPGSRDLIPEMMQSLLADRF